MPTRATGIRKRATHRSRNKGKSKHAGNDNSKAIKKAADRRSANKACMSHSKTKAAALAPAAPDDDRIAVKFANEHYSKELIVKYYRAFSLVSDSVNKLSQAKVLTLVQQLADDAESPDEQAVAAALSKLMHPHAIDFHELLELKALKA